MFTDPFGTRPSAGDPDGNGLTLRFNLRLLGQLYDGLVGLHCNYFRDYDPATGRYVELDPIGLAGGLHTYTYAYASPVSYSDTLGLNPAAGCLAGAWAGPAGCGIGAAIGTAVAGGAALAAILRIPSDASQQCDDKPCPPCKTVSGKTIPLGTVAYRPLDTPPKPQHGIVGLHYNLYKANQNPKNCRCFWQSIGAVTPSALPSDAIPIEPFAN